MFISVTWLFRLTGACLSQNLGNTPLLEVGGVHACPLKMFRTLQGSGGGVISFIALFSFL